MRLSAERITKMVNEELRYLKQIVIAQEESQVELFD